MSIQKIKLGTTVGDKTGDGARTAGAKINANFEYLENKIENRNKVFINAGFVQVGNKITFNAGWKWIINEIIYQNPAAVEVSIPLAADGKSRVDNIVATTSNTFMRIAGVESETPVAPADLNGTIIVAFALVNNTAVQDSGNVDPEKLNRGGYNGTAATLDQKIDGTREDLTTRIDDFEYEMEEIKLPLKADKATTYTKEEVNSKLVGIYKFKGNKADFTDLLATTGMVVGDVYNLLSNEKNYGWTGTSWDDLGGVFDISGKEDVINKSQDIGTDKASLTKYASVKAIYDWCVSLFQLKLVSGTNIKSINGTSILEAGNLTVGDMTTNTAQSVSGLKIFLNGMLGLRNVANTFTSFFSNSNTASRTYILQNRDGTLADLADIAAVNTGKMNVPAAGVVNYLPKFLTGGITMGLSRLLDTGTFFGIGTANAPTKDFTFGNQSNREIGVENSSNTAKGRDLIISAGTTINYVLNSNFNPLSQTNRGWFGISAAPNGNVYAVVLGGDIYMQTGGTGNFNPLSQTSRSWYSISAAPNGNVYAVVLDGDIYMQTGGTGNFNPLSQTSRSWRGVSAAPNGNVYAVVENGDIYMQTGGTGNFNPLSQTSRSWHSISAAPNGNIYAVVRNGDIYMQTGGTGNFNPLSQTNRGWFGISAAPNGNVYAVVNGGDIYMQTGGTGNFNPLSQTILLWKSITVASNGNVYSTVENGDIYMQQNNGTGTANLDGGTVVCKAGTGKGTGKSRHEVWTGQKTTSGTNMQILTLREYIDENGYHIYTSMPIYADNAAAIAGGLPIGCEYRTATGIKMIVF